jgi:hypothetical protein
VHIGPAFTALEKAFYSLIDGEGDLDSGHVFSREFRCLGQRSTVRKKFDC